MITESHKNYRYFREQLKKQSIFLAFKRIKMLVNVLALSLFTSSTHAWTGVYKYASASTNCADLGDNSTSSYTEVVGVTYGNMMCTQMISTNSAGNITISWKKTDYDFDNDNFINYSSNRGCPNNTCTGGCYPITHEAGTFSKEDYRDLTLNKCVIYTPWDVSLSLWGATQGSNVRQINYGQHYPQKEKNEGNKSRGGGWVSGGAIAGIVIGVAAVIALIVFMATGGPKNMCKRDSGALTPPPATAVNEIYYTKSARSLSPHSFPSSTPGVDAEHNPLQRDVEMKPFRNGSQDPIGFSSSSNPDSVVEMPAPMAASVTVAVANKPEQVKHVSQMNLRLTSPPGTRTGPPTGAGRVKTRSF